ncbi:hypothetical protein [Rhizobium nepotum]|uniref:hypothetical protein n=1 Tax=Rhizobium nepotum TaxID=1035271 RepID=UPI003CEC2A98
MVKPRENRVPIMMSEDELLAVDDWRFSNRIATRSEAIRRLAASGITLHSGANAYFERTSKMVEECARLESDIRGAAERIAPLDKDGLPDLSAVDARQALALAALCVEITETLVDQFFEYDEQNIEWLRASLTEAYGLQFNDFTPIARVNEWLRAFIRKALEEK